MRVDELYEEKIDELLRAISDQPILEKSPLGKYELPIGGKKKVVPMKVRAFSEDAEVVHNLALSIIRSGDVATWQRMRDAYFQDFGSYADIFGNNTMAMTHEEFNEKASIILNKLSPLFIFSLTGRNSRVSLFCDQDRWLQALLSSSTWPKHGWTKVIDLPQCFAFIYHSIHGALCVKTDQVKAAIDTIDRQYKSERGRHDFSNIYYHSECMGVGHDALYNWQFLKGLHQRWNWLNKMFFASPIDYQSSLASYYLALNIEEYMSCVKNDTDFSFPIMYPHFVNVSNDVADQAIIYLINQKEYFQSSLKGYGLDKKTFSARWGKWLAVCYKATNDDFFFSSDVKHSVFNATPEVLFT